MHELSIAGAIFDLALRHTPPGATLRRVRVKSGPMRAIDPDAMDAAWDAERRIRNLPDIALDLTLLPWSLACPACNRRWTSPDLDAACACGHPSPTPLGGDELQIVSIEIDDPKPTTSDTGFQPVRSASHPKMTLA